MFARQMTLFWRFISDIDECTDNLPGPDPCLLLDEKSKCSNRLGYHVCECTDQKLEWDEAEQKCSGNLFVRRI